MVTYRVSAGQRGAATLIVVMALFLVMALLAAYANRGLLFEQRIAGGYFRASLSQEVSEAGIEWALAQLNGTAVDAVCRPAATGGTRFVDRYLQINAQTRQMTPASLAVLADCRRDAANQGWSCRCPAAGGWTAPAAAAGSGINASFGVLMAAGPRPGTITVNSRGCTDSVVANCYGSAVSNSVSQLAHTTDSAMLAFVSAVRTPPAAALIASGLVDSQGAGLGLHNSDPRSAGALLISGGARSGLLDARMDSIPGTEPNQAMRSEDPKTASADLLWTFLGSSKAAYKRHPALRTVACDGDCGPALAAAYAAGKRIVWIDGPLSLTSSQTLGSPTDPMVIVADGAVSLDGPMQINGLLVALGRLDWSNSSGMPSRIAGAVVVQGDVATQGAVDIVYQASIADLLRNRVGGFVRVPGGWIDWGVAL
ncbi:MAG: hypothetical protein DI603_14695 [Roseateles depolymerans]|uniref:Type 4 fimbrial biogenesis protein PilX N-terminal domain-containing protein n=1 Tax=Roseateles depolymerans TaxID=76731 RepID=A0A2W5DIG0_9BURK|nr:MAG: hypothetical protein DI603_14695 [Roseateles depolymerans]